MNLPEQVDCDKELEKIASYCKNHYMKDKLHIKYSSIGVENGKKGDPLINELWIDGTKFKYQNPFLVVFQDEKMQALILKDKKTIMLKDVVPVSSIKPQLSGQLDTLKKLTSSVKCHREEKQNHIVLDFPEMSGGKRNIYKKIDLLYEAKTGRLIEGEYDINLEGESKKEIYQYSEVDENFSSEILGPVLSEIATGNSLNQKYKGYVVRDQRKKNKK